MTFASALSFFFDYLIILPAMVFFYLPIREHLREPKKNLLRMAALCVVLALLTVGLCWLFFPIQPNYYLFFVGGLGYLACLCLSDLPWYKLLALFTDILCLFTFSGILDRYVDCIIHPYGRLEDMSTYGLVVQWAFLLTALGLLWRPLKKHYPWLLRNLDDKRTWCVACLVPALLAGMNMVMVPQYNQNMWVGRTFTVAVLISCCLFLLLLAFHMSLFFVAKSITERSQSQRKNELLEIQARQYARLSGHIEQTNRMYHDLRHSVRTLSALTETGDLEAVRDYLRDYSATLPVNVIGRYCKNLALNALLSYYAEFAEKAGIQRRIRIDLPEEPSVSEVDLCSIIGNMLENAIAASMKLLPEKRFVQLCVEAQEGGDIYIASENNFDGELRESGGKLYSTRHTGEGIGLKSMRSIAEQHGGRMRTYVEGERFCVDISLRAAPAAPNP